MLRLFLASSALLAALLLSATPTSAQIFPTSSEDPLSGSVFATTAFVPSVTFTPVGTFASAETREPTSLVGVGPSLSPDTYTFAYSVPLTTVQGTDLGNVYASLAAASSPTAATNALQPNPTDLQIVPGTTATPESSASRLKSGGSMGLVVLAGVLGGMGLVFV